MVKRESGERHTSNITLWQGDCLKLMKDIPDGSVDLTVTSPPYDNLRTYNGNIDQWNFEKFQAIAKELYRITADGGVVVWIVADATIKGSETGTSFRQALWFMECGFNLHDTMIYQKANTLPLTHRRYEQSFEFMFVFSKGVPRTFNPILKLNKTYGEIRGGTHRISGSELMRKNTIKSVKKKSQKINVWVYAVGKGGSTSDIDAFKHPAIFPESLANDHIISWSNEGDTVFDPFMGSGTTGKMAKLLNRNFIGSELDQGYFDIAKQRIDNARGG